MMNKQFEEIIRVDQAGEFGAKVIYQGQIDALKLKGVDTETLDLIKHMKKQEDEHFDYFNEKIKMQKIRPTVMHPIWKAGGYALGFLTAFIDKRAAMACTTAVEEVIDEHYQEQLDYLEKEGGNDELKEKIQKFREEELEHRDIGYEHEAADLSYFKPLSAFIKGTTKFAIAVSKKI
ncbi:MAG: demethoxyubiquinone hydroxylase family protein [Rickettsiales bacterium]|nr:demethoxyubiquinone hydroxylase family protein [Rickettsiales bacterium]